MQDVSELKKAYAELENMVIYDQLTGVYSMYSFMEHCKQYDEYNGSVAVVVCDINHLSDINIQYGPVSYTHLMHCDIFGQFYHR